MVTKLKAKPQDLGPGLADAPKGGRAQMVEAATDELCAFLCKPYRFEAFMRLYDELNALRALRAEPQKSRGRPPKVDPAKLAILGHIADFEVRSGKRVSLPKLFARHIRATVEAKTGRPVRNFGTVLIKDKAGQRAGELRDYKKKMAKAAT